VVHRRSLCSQKLIGKGSYGKVYRAAHKKDGHLRAFKVLPLDDDSAISEETRRELLSLRQCDSAYVVKFHGAYSHDCQLWIAMEYCTVSVQGAMRLSGQPLCEAEVAAVCLQSLRGLQYLHTQRHLIHRDVKAANILLTDDGQVKLADFGVAAQLSGTLAKRSTVIVIRTCLQRSPVPRWCLCRL
jgi:serine/threonine-protein kinase 24/25/MST4